MSTSITATHEDMTRALREASKAAGRRVFLPVLTHALVAPAADADGFTVQATDFEVWTHRVVDGIADGSMLLPIVACVAALKGVRGSLTPKRAAAELVTFTRDGTVVTVSGFGRELTVDRESSPDLDDFPSWPAPSASDNGFTADAVDLRAAFGFAAVAAGRDGTLPALTAVRFESADGRLELAATDRYRLAVCGMSAVTHGEWAALVPATSLGMLTDVTGKVTATVGDGYIRFAHEEGTIHVRQIDATFPNVRHVIPTEGDVWTVNRARLLEDVAAAGGVAERNAPITVTFDAETVTVSGNAPLRCISTTPSPAALRGFNPAFLADALKSFTQPEVTITAHSPLEPHTFRGDVANVPNALHLIMPTRMPS